jgi:hypothetical protein
VSTRRLSLRRADVCAVCGAELVVGAVAWWNRELRTVSCRSCHDASIVLPKAGNVSTATAVDSLSPEVPRVRAGEAGRSALEEYQRLHEKREARIDAKFGRFAGVVKFLTDDPQSITAWKKGSIGEQKLAKTLQENLGDRAIMLHDRTVPRTRGNIDHLVIASSGVWVVDAKNYSGLVQQRDVGGFFKVDKRLYVGGRDRSTVVDGLDWQAKSVTKALGDLDVRVLSAICFTDAEWGWLPSHSRCEGSLCLDQTGYRERSPKRAHSRRSRSTTSRAAYPKRCRQRSEGRFRPKARRRERRQQARSTHWIRNVTRPVPVSGLDNVVRDRGPQVGSPPRQCTATVAGSLSRCVSRWHWGQTK